jgi:hypothetical protein
MTPLPFAHDVPDTEPSEGAIATFRTACTDGSISNRMLIRTIFGWAESPAGRNARTWRDLTTQEGPTGAVQVHLIAQRGNHRERYVELESAVYAAAERLKIPTRVFRTGIGTQDIPPLALIAEMERQLTDNSIALVAERLRPSESLQTAAEVLALRRLDREGRVTGKTNEG